MKFYTAQDTIRLTLSQAIVKYLQTQYSERDGVQRRFIQGVWGILGHGNVSGLEPGARRVRSGLAVSPTGE